MTAEPCDDKALLLQADQDGELDAAAAAALAVHVQSCAACANTQADLRRLSAVVKGGATQFDAPPGLRRAVTPRARRGQPEWRIAGSFGAGLAVAASIALLVSPGLVSPDRQPPTGEIVSAHIRALQPGHLVDVGSSDRHTVKPWFDGRLDFAPPVQDFTAQRFPLIGGRLDYVAGRPVAALVYGRDRHLIDVFIWKQPAGGAKLTVDTQIQGYNIAGWSADGMNFRAVSDLNRGELEQFIRLFRAPG